MKYEYVLDMYALAELFDGTEKARIIRELVNAGKCAISVIALAELSDKCAREQRDSEPLVTALQATVAILPLSNEIAVAAGKVKNELRKTARNISLADSIHFQTAQSVEAVFVTGDPDFKDIKNKKILFME